MVTRSGAHSGAEHRGEWSTAIRSSTAAAAACADVARKGVLARSLPPLVRSPRAVGAVFSADVGGALAGVRAVQRRGDEGGVLRSLRSAVLVSVQFGAALVRMTSRSLLAPSRSVLQSAMDRAGLSSAIVQ